MTEHDGRINEDKEVNAMDTTPLDPALRANDDALLAALGEALARARHPRQDELIAKGQDAFSFAAITDELAALVFDSLWEDKLESASRATVIATRTLAFESDDLSLEIEISDDGVVGQVSPPGPAEVVAERPDGRRSTVHTDELGSFTLRAPGSGPLRFRLRRDASTAVTDWINITA
jgi:hypothetical protein